MPKEESAQPVETAEKPDVSDVKMQEEEAVPEDNLVHIDIKQEEPEEVSAKADTSELDRRL